MLSYIVRRVLWAIPTVILISFVIFWIMWLSPIDPFADPLLGNLNFEGGANEHLVSVSNVAILRGTEC